MIRKRRTKSNNPPGEDSFLDVVANLVGILIILVVVIGAQASSSWIKAVENTDQDQELASIQQKLKSTTQQALSYEKDHHELLDKIRQEEALTHGKQKVRHKMLVELEFARQNLDEKKEEMDEVARVGFEQQNEKSKLQNELQRINSTIQTLQISKERKIETIEHFPSPVARTVFNKEFHYQLKGGRLTEVPIERLIDLVKGEIRLKAEKLMANSNSTVETVGPIGDFRMQYLLQAANVMMPTPSGPMKQRTVEFKQFILVPAGQQIGVPLESALQSGSEFDKFVSQLENEKTTFSIWVYPEDYAEFRQLKKFLIKRGIQTAVWPLPENAPISGGPDGFRSSSQ